jgi:hypothetical protein
VAFLCDVLNLSWSELEQQPAWWVEQMVEYYEQKGLAEKHKATVEENRLKSQRKI